MKADILPCEEAVTITDLPGFTITYDLGTPDLETLAGELLEQTNLEQCCNACPRKCHERRRRILRQLKVALVTALNRQASQN